MALFVTHTESADSFYTTTLHHVNVRGGAPFLGLAALRGFILPTATHVGHEYQGIRVAWDSCRSRAK